MVVVMVLHSLARNGENVGARLAGTLPTILLAIVLPGKQSDIQSYFRPIVS